MGVFLRYSTMPTIVHYNHFDRVLGRQLKPVVKGSSTLLSASSTVAARRQRNKAEANAVSVKTKSGDQGSAVVSAAAVRPDIDFLCLPMTALRSTFAVVVVVVSTASFENDCTLRDEPS